MVGKVDSANAQPDRATPLDVTDRGILTALRGDGRLSIRALAVQLNISRANAYARVQRLEQSGVVTGYTATINPQRCGYGVSAYVYLKISQRSWKSIQQRVASIPEVEHAALVAGEYDIVLLVRAQDTAGLRDLVLTQFHEMPDVLSTETVLIFEELPLPSAWQLGPGR